MKVNKVQATIYIFERIFKNGTIKKNDIQNELDISDVTFRRYIQELRAFLTNFSEECEIIYDKSTDSYVLIRNDISRKEKYKYYSVANEKDVKRLFEELNELSKNDSLIYRGHTSDEFSLLPSMYRNDLLNEKVVEQVYINENAYLEAFEKYTNFDNKMEFFQTLQHYGMKTKLLDFTHNPFVGLLFAVEDWPLSNDNSQKDGELIIIDKSKYEQIECSHYDTLGELIFEERSGVSSLTYSYSNDKEIRAIFSKDPRYLDGIAASPRIKRQDGCFLLFPNLDCKIKTIDKASAYKIYRIDSGIKAQIIKMLKEKCQISMDSLFI